MKRRRFLGGLGILPVIFTKPLWAKTDEKRSRENLIEPVYRTKPDNEAAKIAEENPLAPAIENELGYYRIQSRAGRALVELGGFTVKQQEECRKAICKRLPAVKDFRRQFLDYKTIHQWYDGIASETERGVTIWCAIELSYRGVYRGPNDFMMVDGFEFFGIDLELEILKAKFPVGSCVAVEGRPGPVQPAGRFPRLLPAPRQTGEVVSHDSMLRVWVRFYRQANSTPSSGYYHEEPINHKYLKLVI